MIKARFQEKLLGSPKYSHLSPRTSKKKQECYDSD